MLDSASEALNTSLPVSGLAPAKSDVFAGSLCGSLC
jgi:hypothetical protein